jgi:hypothetical protein
VSDYNVQDDDALAKKQADKINGMIDEEDNTFK